jgi:radical SAM protein with 4Fe4S-binding SPASM domain
MTKLDYVQWDITSICNLKCLHCREKATLSSVADDLSLEEAKNLIDQIVAYQTHTLSIAGGEPLLSPIIWQVLEYARGKFKRLVVSSNGTTIDHETAIRLGEFVTTVQVSIDGANAETHDRMRGQGNFAKAVQAIGFLQDAGVTVATRMTLHKGNSEEVREYVDLAQSLGLPDAYLRRVIPIGNAKKYGLVTLTAQELKKALGTAIEYGRSLSIHVASADYFCQIAFNDVARAKAQKIQAMGGQHIGGCAIGHSSFYVMQNGVIVYCPYLPVFCGDLRKETLELIWKNSPMMRVARSLRHNLKGKCAACEYKFACGGCRAYAHATTGDILAEDSGCWL